MKNGGISLAENPKMENLGKIIKLLFDSRSHCRNPQNEEIRFGISSYYLMILLKKGFLQLDHSFLEKKGFFQRDQIIRALSLFSWPKKDSWPILNIP
jgi:hypothetical protein